MKKFKIFIVDDDLFCLNIYEQFMRTIGCNDIACFENGMDCIAHLGEKPNVIFLDHGMEGMSGLETLQEVKRINHHIYVIMLTGQDHAEISREAIKLGAFDYLVKGQQELDKIEASLKRIADIQVMLQRK
jgi:polysaccharide export outer membrane protein